MASSKRIADSEFTVQWLQTVLQEKINTKALIKDVNWTEIGFGLGMLSQILIVNIDWDKNSNDLLPISVVLKIPSMKQFQKLHKEVTEGGDSGLKKQIENLDIREENIEKSSVFKAHSCEVAVYEVFSQVPPPKEMKVPRWYFGRNITSGSQGILVIEDLSQGKTTSLIHGMNAQHMMEAAKAIGALQAYSLTTNAWKTERINYSFMQMGTEENMPDPDQMLPGVIEQLKTENPDMFGEVGPKLVEHCKTMADVTVVFGLNEKLGLPDVFCHGDFHAHNLVFSKNSDGGPGGELVGLIDWQICHPGNMAEDLARCFTSSVPADTRRANTIPALKLYYETLKKQLGKDPPFTFDQVLLSYKEAFKFAAVVTLPGFTFVANNPGFMCKDLADPEAAKKELKERMKGLIEDAIGYFEEAK